MEIHVKATDIRSPLEYGGERGGDGLRERVARIKLDKVCNCRSFVIFDFD